MPDARTVFKRCVVQACEVMRTEFGAFAASVDFRDFLDETFEVPRSPNEIAIRALDQLCEGDPKLYDPIVCLGVVKFLDEVLGHPQQDRGFQRLIDLRDLVEGTVKSGQVERWIEGWYER